jgi:hypothetical protein
VPVTPLRPSDPSQVGPHRLLARLGQGGMGTVYLGVSPDERAVAVKVLRDGVPDPEARRRFRHELTALRRVRGPHLVEVLDADVEADTPYLVTRFVPGHRLDDLVQRSGPLPPDRLSQLSRGLADALTTLHAAGVVHRDLTPGNVLLVDGHPHVIDLGLATAADLTIMTRSGQLVGTPGYLAPEQITGRPVGPAVDLHAWGATVAFAATGRPPYGTGRPEAMLYRIVHDEPDLDGVPAHLEPLVRAAMDADPDRRPSAAAVLSRLGGTTAAEPVTVHLPRDVDPTTLLTVLPDSDALSTQVIPAATRELVAAASVPVRRPPPDPPAYPPALQPDPYDEGEGAEDLVPWEDAAPPVRRSAARSLQALLTAVACLALVGAGTLVAPVVGAGAVLLLLVAMRAVARAGERLRGRVERRGGRRRDPVVAALGAPWHLVLSALETLLTLPLLLLVAAAPAAVVWFADPALPGIERFELAAATATVVALATGLSRAVHRPSRRMLRGALVSVTPGVPAALAVLLVVTALAGLLVAAAEGSAPLAWPLEQLPR